MITTEQNEVSLARKILLSEIKKKTLKDFLTKGGVLSDSQPEVSRLSTQKGVYYIANGKTSQNFHWIFRLRNVIPPLYWFSSGDSDPASLSPTQFTDRHEDYSLSSPTLGITKLISLNSVRGAITDLAAQADLSKNCLYSMYTKVNGSYHLRPTEKIVSSLAPFIKADWWYIYPDEVSDDIREDARKPFVTGQGLAVDRDKLGSRLAGHSFYNSKFDEFYAYLEKNISRISEENKQKLLALLSK